MEKYEVVSVVGEGSFGRVYKAKVLNSDKYVALKLIVKVSLPKNINTKKLISYFRKEELVKKLQD